MALIGNIGSISLNFFSIFLQPDDRTINFTMNNSPGQLINLAYFHKYIFMFSVSAKSESLFMFKNFYAVIKKF